MEANPRRLTDREVRPIFLHQRIAAAVLDLPGHQNGVGRSWSKRVSWGELGDQAIVRERDLSIDRLVSQQDLDRCCSDGMKVDRLTEDDVCPKHHRSISRA